MSDMRRAARGLVETRSERFESLHSAEESRRRLVETLARLGTPRAVRFTQQWEMAEGRPVLVAQFAPPPGTQRFLKALSLGMALLLAASGWALFSGQASGSAAFLLPMITVLAILGFPFLVLALASNREADESRIRRAIRIALRDEQERLPPAQRWADED